MITAGTGGAITGRGANAFVGDDLVKGAQDAASETMQNTAWDWWQSEASTRLEIDHDGLEPIVLLVMTRWNEADILGRILGNEDEQDDDETWYSIVLPALAEEGDPLGRAPGEALWPERRPLQMLERIKSRLSAYWWSALFQQRPTPLEGDLFKRAAWQYYDVAPAGFHPGYIFVDTAGWKDIRSNDFAAYASIIRVQKDLYWLNAKHGRWTFPQLLQELRDEHDRTGLPICVEDVPWARPIIQTLQAELEGVVPFVIGGLAKEVRAMSASPYQHAGNFHLPRGKSWTKEFVDEHAAFPNGMHDDWVDTTSMGAIRLLRAALQPLELPPEEPRGDVVVIGGRA
jgi:predicted phage terminase large subunit-like protein